VNGPILQEKAKQIAAQLGHNDFGGTMAFVDRFKARNKVIFETIHREANTVSMETTSDWINKKLPLLLKDYQPKDIFNGDELGLFYRSLPTKTFKVKGSRCKTGKQSRERVTIFICANMDGSEKVQLTFIRKYRNPRCFKGTKKLPVNYMFNCKAWMTSTTFEESLKKINKQMIKEDRHILLFVDNCSSHPHLTFSNIKLAYLPPNTTSVLQPMDQGVIKCFKGYYRTRLIQKLIAIMDSGNKPLPASISILDAIYMAKFAWDQVSTQTIKNCFIKSGFTFNETQTCGVEEVISEPDGWEEVSKGLDIADGCTFEEFIGFDDGLSTSQEVNELNIVENNSQGIDLGDSSNTEINEDNAEDSEEVTPKVSLKDVIKSLNTLQLYASQRDSEDLYQDLINKLQGIESAILSNHTKNC
jgi:hypothetical protein